MRKLIILFIILFTFSTILVGCKIGYNLTDYLAELGNNNKDETEDIIKVKEWQVIGAPLGDYNNTGSSSLYVYNGIPYVAFVDSSGDYPVVKKYENEEWKTLGDLKNYQVNTMTGDGSVISIVADHTGIPNLAFVKNDMSRYYVISYNNTDNSWDILINHFGTPHSISHYAYDETTYYIAYYSNGSIFTYNGENNVNLGVGLYPSLCANKDGTPYVAFYSNWTDHKLMIKKFDETWDAIDEANSDMIVSDYGIDYISLSVYYTIPYVSYYDYQDNQVYVKSYNYYDTTWDVVGNQAFSNATVDYDKSLAVYNDTAYLAFTDSIYSDKASVASCTNNEGTWEPVGGSYGFTDDKAYHISIHVDNGIPYIAYHNDHGEIIVMKYD